VHTLAATPRRFASRRMAGAPWNSHDSTPTRKEDPRHQGMVALVHEQGQNFAVMAVKDRVIDDPSLREEMMAFSETEWGVRTALVGENNHRTWGPDDIVRWLEDVFLEELLWRGFWFNN
jgi:hypothetical protein